MRWANRVFQYLLATTDVNTNFARSYFFEEELEEQVDFRFNLGEELINNPYTQDKKGDKKKGRAKKAGEKIKGHDMVSLPAHKTFKGSRLVPCKTAYIQLYCSC